MVTVTKEHASDLTMLANVLNLIHDVQVKCLDLIKDSNPESEETMRLLSKLGQALVISHGLSEIGLRESDKTMIQYMEANGKEALRQLKKEFQDGPVFPAIELEITMNIDDRIEALRLRKKGREHGGN